MKAVVFDMDGVLFDTERVCMESWVAVAERRGMEGMREVFPLCIGRNNTDDERIVREHYGEDFAYEDFRREASEEFWEMIKEQGVGNYSIYWDKDTNLLFAYQECSKEGNSQDTENVDPITQKWWDMMADIMEVNPDNSPVSIPLEEVFHLD